MSASITASGRQVSSNAAWRGSSASSKGSTEARIVARDRARAAESPVIVTIETHHRGGCGVRVLTGVPGSLVGGKRHPLIGALLRSLYKSRVARQIIARWCGA